MKKIIIDDKPEKNFFEVNDSEVLKNFMTSLGRCLLDFIVGTGLIIAFGLAYSLYTFSDHTGNKNDITTFMAIAIFIIAVVAICIFCFRLYLLIDIDDNLKGINKSIKILNNNFMIMNNEMLANMKSLSNIPNQDMNNNSQKPESAPDISSRLAKLKGQGIITEEEYLTLKNNK